MWLTLRSKGQFMNMTLRAAACGRRLLTSDEIPVEEFLDKHLAPTRTSSPLFGLTTTRREVLSLYRDIWRATRVFTWPNEAGVPWKDILRLSARREFEAAIFEKDPEMIARLLVVGRDAVRMTLEKVKSGFLSTSWTYLISHGWSSVIHSGFGKSTVMSFQQSSHFKLKTAQVQNWVMS